MPRRTLVACMALAFALTPCGAQSVSGRVTDDKGAPIARARVLVRLTTDTTGAARYMTYTDDRGDYRVPLGQRGRYQLSALRLGYRSDSGRTIDVGMDDARAMLVMRNAPMPLPAVGVVAHADLSCLA